MHHPEKPLVTIVLPCRNEVQHIEACLLSILGQKAPAGGFEIIVADGMSNDGTREVLEQMTRKYPQIRFLSNPGRIAATGLNAAIRASRGEIIVRMDAHTTYASDYLISCLEVMSRTGADNVGGPVRTTATTFMERAIQAVFHSPFAVGGARNHEESYEGYIDTVCYGCWRKDVFETIGYFDEELVRNQDDEHNLRLVRSGRRVYQSPSIRSWYRVRGSLSAVFRQYMQYGYWKVLVIRKHNKPASIRHLVPGGFLAALCLLLLAGLVWPHAWFAAVGLATVYTVAVCFASVITAFRKGWSLLPVLPAIFACFHFGYGYGFLRGVLDFVILYNAPNAKFVQLTRGQIGKPARSASQLSKATEH